MSWEKLLNVCWVGAWLIALCALIWAIYATDWNSSHVSNHINTDHGVIVK